MKKIVFVADAAPHGPRGNHEFVRGHFFGPQLHAPYPNAFSCGGLHKKELAQDLSHADTIIVGLNDGRRRRQTQINAAVRKGARALWRFIMASR